MIISKTPFRISFFGGGTDYPTWFNKHNGAVLSTSIDKYCYLSVRHLPSFFDFKHRFSYSDIELVNELDDIKHPSIRETLKYLKVTKGLEIHHSADLPSRTGLGTSSSFTVGLLNALYALHGISTTKQQLTQNAIHIEQNLISESVGSQDQTIAAYGGLNYIEFTKEGNISASSIAVSWDRVKLLQDHLLLFFTGFTRIASDIAKTQIEEIPNKKTVLDKIYNQVDEGIKILENSNREITDFGKLLHEGWLLKRSITDKISTPQIDNLYNSALNHGAIGGKLLGAGGGGFLLLFVEPEMQPYVKNALSNLLYVPFKFENTGSSIIHNSNY